MKTDKKLLILCLLFFIWMISSCVSVQHETTSGQPRMTLKEAIASMKEAVKDSKSNPFFATMKPVKDIDVSADGITIINDDGTRRYVPFNVMQDPYVAYDHILNHYAAHWGPITLNLANYVQFNTNNSAKMFADALYTLKHMDIKAEQEKERKESERRVQQTAIDEQKERDKKQEESLRLMRKTAIKDDSDATRDETIADSTTKKRKSQPRPTPPRKSAAEPPQGKPEGGAPPLPALPAGGAVSGQ